jgi:hypothetical protein
MGKEGFAVFFGGSSACRGYAQRKNGENQVGGKRPHLISPDKMMSSTRPPR